MWMRLHELGHINEGSIRLIYVVPLVMEPLYDMLSRGEQRPLVIFPNSSKDSTGLGRFSSPVSSMYSMIPAHLMTRK